MSKKEMYEGKQRYADRVFRESVEKADGKLTEAQLSAIYDVRSDRHWFHVNGENGLINDESPEHDRAVFIATGSWWDEDEWETLRCLGCGEPYLPGDYDCFMSDGDWYDVMSDEDKAQYYDAIGNSFYAEDPDRDHAAFLLFLDKAQENNAALVERINGEIEHWLAAVDEKYGTSFAPTGNSRLLN